MEKVVFYGINGVGLGHIARLSVIQRQLQEHHPEIETEAFCRSTMGPTFFSCPCTNVPKRRDLMKALGVGGINWHLQGLTGSRQTGHPKTIIFDSYWSPMVTKRLREAGHRCILVMESLKPEFMVDVLPAAMENFDQILFPCEQDELAHHYKDHAKIWKLLNAPCFNAIGPLARQFEPVDQKRRIIFSLGGGGEHPDEAPDFTVDAFLQRYRAAATILKDSGETELYLAKGPLLRAEHDIAPLIPLETMELPKYFNAQTAVISRGSYNLTWEAIAAGASLIATDVSTVSREAVASRNTYLAQQGYIHYAQLSGDSIAQAVKAGPPQHTIEASRLTTHSSGMTSFDWITRREAQ